MKSTKNKKIQQLKKYIDKNLIYWEKFEKNGEIEVEISPNFNEIGIFTEIISEYLDENIKPEEQTTNFLESPINIKLLHYQVNIKMSDICKFYGIDMNEIFVGDSCE